MSDCLLPAHAPRRALWWRGVGWLALLGPLFFITYGQVNQFTAGRENIGSVVFDWEQHIPFLPWTIVPYWSIDLLYGLSLFVCTSFREQTRHAWRLIAASLVACAGFLLFPLKFSFVRPPGDGLYGWLFQQLEMFDLPYNQAPSLHIMLAWLLWLRFWPHLRPAWRAVMSGWFALIAVSVLTTWQHHAIDVVTGLLAGALVSYAIPVHGGWRRVTPDARGRRLARRYLTAALVCMLIALWFPACWLLWWPAIALALVALAYAGLGVAVFRKRPSGQLSPSARLLLMPCLAGAKLSARWFMRRLAPVSDVAHGLSIGGYPFGAVSQPAVLDLSAELARSRFLRRKDYHCVPMLDLVAPDVRQLDSAVTLADTLHQRHGALLIHCALGLSRSALVAAAWLLKRGLAATPAAACEQVRHHRPQVVLPADFLKVLEQWHNQNTTIR
ncbi:phosphatase PAP2/dual specificity phosphatase family protein [Entomohabitans teleogrylli]|uniref:phosphatase PAP2/dual specificity phosphatase family protein n=1 Tax=Entomohabitans teleogrylli TaxID=1384589 RepID=UPI00073D374F|nr:phosphatase PAP2/dual specificity phosphatase family protein [Entomohabitans teleogrylli]